VDTLEADRRPNLVPEEARRILEERFGLGGSLSPLPSYRDQNFRVDGEAGPVGVLKIVHPAEDPDFLDLEREALERLGARCPEHRFPRVRPALDGRTRLPIESDGRTLWVRLLDWVPGIPLAVATPKTTDLDARVGALMGAVDRSLDGLDAPAAHRVLRWDLRRAPQVIDTHAASVSSEGRRDLIARLAQASATRLAPYRDRLRLGLVHNDANDHNLLVTDVRGRPEGAADRRVEGLIDFGDLVHSWIAAEPAIAATYAMLGRPDALRAAAAVVGGYHGVHALTEDELAALPSLIVQRLLVSVCVSAAEGGADPENAYLTVSEAPAWAMLETLDRTSLDFFSYLLRAACGLEPYPGASKLNRTLTRLRAGAAPVLHPDPRSCETLTFDLSVGSLELGSDADALDMAAFDRRVSERLGQADAAVGLGRYDEPRRWYDGPAYEVAGDDSERRTIHLGIDLFAPPGTPVCAPLEGVVHAVAHNDQPLDYGPTLILEHAAGAEDPPFYTLYGHLDPAVLDERTPGEEVRAGQVVAALGGIDDNGGWPPHLHFQIVADLLDREGEFPGVAPPGERSVWLALSPDPNRLLGIPGLESAPRGSSAERILDERERRLGPSLSVSYREPLKIVRGRGTYLFDDVGRRFLDCVNNVAHVGHSHPRVVAAGAAQMGVLNTNTRYLHDNLVRYATRLAATLPDPLEVCFFVCSGSEANELALRLARTHTDATDVLVVDGAYHGNTTSLVDLSPYKFDGPGGRGAPEHVHTVVMPDPYRGPHRDGEPNLGRRYAESVTGGLHRIAERGRRPAAFFCESILSCGGQIVLPEGYLPAAVSAVREAGGLYVADEVQVGFGRVGTDFWAFVSQGVVPDIVTMGKPIGNGHPLGAVVTTREIAASFANGMEYFNTFGGNPVSCAIGLAVLDVIADEDLQAAALDVGHRFKRGLEAVGERHAVVGDVRGRGLFIGIELVTDRTARTPAPAHASHVVERMRQHGILLSTDGPEHNVIKIKPPLVFGAAEADRVVETLDRVLTEDALQPS
jgi:4-aminobutyrate aminotransferase-like enzyme/Ser/Thr protein kinase RdoA (MazF antagonist)